MSIRKRYDEAQTLAKLGMIEAALILLMICVSAASREWGKSQSKGRVFNPRGKDKKLFVGYLSKLIPDAFVENSSGGQTLCEFCYNEIRNPAIHEAKLSEVNFTTEQITARFHLGTIVIGAGIISDISLGLRRDRRLRDAFRDILLEGDNIVVPLNPETLDNDRDALFEKFEVTYKAIITEIDNIIRASTPELLISMKYQEMCDFFAAQVLRKFQVFQINEGSFVGLKIAVRKGEFDESERLIRGDNCPTLKGYEFIKELSSLYYTADKGGDLT